MTTITSPHIDTVVDHQLDKVWKVIVLDDPVTPMLVVTMVFQKVFGYPKEKAEFLMLTVHHEGKAVVWDGAQDRAIHYCTQLQAAGLMASVEEDK